MRHLYFLLIILFFVSHVSLGQVESQVNPPEGTLPTQQDSLVIQPDTLQLPADTTLRSDTTAVPADSAQAQQGDIETTINYSARDSIRASMDGKRIWLYGNAKIKYGEIELEADQIIIDYANNTLTAHGSRDSLGQRVGYPIFKNGPELYETKDIVYNFATKRAKITEVVTQQGEGYLHGDAVFKNEDNELFTIRNSYTTCNLEHPHYRIRSTRAKAIPNDKIVSGPFYFEFNDIPLPLGFAFGMFPAQRESKSGIIFPSYGEERVRGFNLRQGGYFFDISEYVKLAVTGDIYSRGGHALYLNSNYNKRYAYTGSLNFTYSKTRLGTRIEDPSVSNDYRLTWSHSPQSKGTGRFAASVNAATATFNRNNNLIYGASSNDIYSSSLNNITAKLRSNVSYNKKFAGTPFSMGLNASHSQDLQTRLVDLQLPNLTVTMTNLYPFQRRDGEQTPLDNFSVGYNMAATNQITNNLGRINPLTNKDSIAPFTSENFGLFFKNGRKGVRHNIPISHSLKAFKYFTLSPSISYEEKWYFEQLDWRQESVNGVNTFVADTIHRFNRVANYSFSTSLNTRIYGTYFFKRGNVKAIRHVINPTISFNATPDFTKNENYFQEFTRISPTGDTTIVYQARHQGFVYGPSGTGKTGSIGFGVGNNVEMKVKNETDTVSRKVMLLNNLSINSSYNFVADSFKLAPFNISANTNIKDNLVNVNLSATLDPYAYVNVPINPENPVLTREIRTRNYAWKAGSLGRITNATLALSTNLNPKAREQEQASREKIANSDLPEQDKEVLIRNPEMYIDFEIPWSLNVSFNMSYRHPLNQKPQVTQTIQFSGDLALSEAWKVNFSSGYHFETAEFTQTTISIARDLHCWTMRFWWVPFGRFQQYNFTINVKSSILQDLKLERRKPFFDNL